MGSSIPMQLFQPISRFDNFAAMLTIRFATINDAELIADISRQTFYETFAPLNGKENMDQFMNDQFTREVLINEVGEADNIFLLAFDDKNPVGYVRLREKNAPTELNNIDVIEIARIYVTANDVGKGVGKALMQECIKIAIEKGKEYIWLGVWQENHRAINFYEKWGFEKFTTHLFMLGDDPQTDWLMKKSISGLSIHNFSIQK
ncbi:MAG: GNAT family N-acetyltransferase [Chitinophagaceae bacterium]|jgi:ribosomal protein S18 acetylase RimI-like enzyme